MKKIGVSLLAALMMVVCVACGKTTGEGKAEIASCEALLNQVWDAFSANETFAVTGGDSNNAVDGAAGAVDVANTDTFVYILHTPEGQIDQIDEAASLIHAMNTNTFTGAALHMKDAGNAEAFVETLKEEIQNTHWMCGFPDIFKIFTVNQGEYVVYAFGSEDNVENFKTHLLEIYGDGVTVSVEERVE